MLGSLCNLYRQPFAPELVSQQFPPPHHTGTFHEAARTLGFKTGTVSLAGIDWQRLPLPAIAFLTSVQIAGTNEIDVSARIPVLILEMGGKTWSVPCCFVLFPVDAQIGLLEQSYGQLKQSMYDGLVMQTRLKGCLDAANDGEWRMAG